MWFSEADWRSGRLVNDGEVVVESVGGVVSGSGGAGCGTGTPC